MPLNLVVTLFQDFLEYALDRIGDDIEDIRNTLEALVDFVVDVLAGQGFDSNVDLSDLLAIKEQCGTNPTVYCYLRSIFKHLNVNTSVLSTIPHCIKSYSLSPEIASSLWSNVSGGSLTFGDCLQSFFGSLLQPFHIGSN